MKFLPALSTLLLTLSLSTASPIPDLDERACLTQAQATAILQAYTALTEKKGDVSSEANKLLAPNFSFLSDSYSSLLGSAVLLSPLLPTSQFSCRLSEPFPPKTTFVPIFPLILFWGGKYPKMCKS